MRRYCCLLSVLFWLSILFSGWAYAQQPWSGVLSSSRAINWTGAGLPATLPDGETTPNPWTPPTRTQCGSTIAGGTSGSPVSVSTINAAMASCAKGTYLLLGSGYFSAASTQLNMFTSSGVTVRGSGPQSTFIVLSGSGSIGWNAAWGVGSATWTGGFSQGATSLTVSSVSGPPLVAGTILFLTQCDTGFSGNPCTGTSADNGGLFICNAQTTCADQQRTNSNESQVQEVFVTSVSGNTVNFTPALHMPNWSSSQTPIISWQSYTSGGSGVAPYGDGLEDMTILDQSSTANPAIFLEYTFASWIKGVRIIGTNGNEALYFAGMNSLLSNSYIYEEVPSALSGNDGIDIMQGGESNLILNNICGIGDCLEGNGSDEGDVIAYNYSRDGNTAYYQDSSFQHEAGSAFILHEGNEIGKIDDDDTWGTHTLNTFFRNYITCGDPPYVIPGGGSSVGLQIDSYSRFENAVGNVIGNLSQCPKYQGTTTGGYAFAVGSTDSLTGTSLMRWGNVTVVQQPTDTPANSGVRFVSSDVASLLSGALSSFSNLVPSTDKLPCSFFLSGYTSTTCTPHPSGGTGLSWWKVCTSWSPFPTSCSGTQLQPFPVAGPDVSGGPYVNGYAYDVPAEVAFHNLPVDSSYQNSYAISSSSWSNGTETLTFASTVLPNTHHLMGGFQLSRVNSACTVGANPANSELQMTASSATTVSYALASNPGVSCTGKMQFPDVREFDERVYETDSAAQPASPSGLTATVQ